MILNFANSELHFSFDEHKIVIKDRVSGNAEEIFHEYSQEVHMILDIQDRLMFKFNVWAIDRNSFDNIREFSRKVKISWP